jgi:two-component system sensor histidine kinase EvgS
MNKWLRYYFFIFVTGILVGCNNTPILNETEKDWLKLHDNLIVGISPNAPPYEYVNENGEITGIFIDFLSLIEQRIDYKFKRVYESDFSAQLQASKTGLIDVLIEIQKTEEREQYLDFTPHLISHPHVIVVRKSQPNIINIGNLTGKSVAVVNKYAVHEYLMKNYPKLNLHPLVDDISCLKAVSNGEVDAFICQQALAIYFIDTEGISNVKIVGEIAYQNELGIATRKQLDTLNRILTKAVISLSNKEKQSIYSKYLSFIAVPFYKEFRFWIIIVTGILIILAVFVVFSLILQKRVVQKTFELNLAKEKAEESDRLKSAFLANMSHEIRTPMNGILGFAGLLKEPGLSGEEQEKYIAVIEKSGERMLNIINDIIDISKIEAGQVKLEIKDTDLNQLTEFLFNFFEPEMVKKNLAFNYKVPPENDHLIIKTDKEKLYAILANLLKNAKKYTHHGSVEFGFSLVDSSVVFYVKDTGIGIPKDRIHAIFDRFVQADIEDTKALQGAGLGLSISKAYATMLGGEISVESEIEQGSVFWIKIPLKYGDDKASGNDNRIIFTDESSQILKNLTVLIAEDETNSEFYLTEILKPLCRKIHHAATGTEAVETYRKNPDIDLILMDIKMPLMNGYEATRLIRTFNKDVIIIAQTAYALSGDREKALAAGCNDYIAKPIKVNELRMLLAKHMNTKQYVIDEK